MKDTVSSFTKTAGPGILFASTAIGVSHLVQSTRAGADFGFLLLGFVVLALLMKYPFFEYGSRYANATQTSIIDGYQKLGKPVLWTYFLLTVASMFFVTGAVG
ncbi:MAG: divalent metal cation transporter, partial [Nitrosarchaeum sp.]|nr:divalent metal cation transporter [Nitrosarchaeum sp.]